MLGWPVHEQGIEPHIPVFDRSGRTDGTFSRKDFTWDRQNDVYHCPAGKTLSTSGNRQRQPASVPRQQIRLRVLRTQNEVLPERAGTEGSTIDP
jgi:hypothetical protein